MSTIEERNTLLRSLCDGPITVVSDWKNNNIFEFIESHDPDINPLIEDYLIPEMTDIVVSFLDWSDFDGLALYSVPLQELTNNSIISDDVPQNVIIFGRMDKAPFMIRGSEFTVSGHVAMQSLRHNEQFTFNDRPSTLFLIGIVGDRWVYPIHEGDYFIWHHNFEDKPIVSPNFAEVIRSTWKDGDCPLFRLHEDGVWPVNTYDYIQDLQNEEDDENWVWED